MQAGLTPVNSRPPFGAYLRSLWQRRAFILAFARASVDRGLSRLDDVRRRLAGTGDAA